MTFDEWYDKNKESLTQATTEYAYRQVWEAAKKDQEHSELKED